MKKLSAIILIFVMALGLLSVGTSAATGTVITNATELANALKTGSPSGTYTVTAKEIDLTGVTYTPMGTSSAPFTGTFDFGGCIVKGISKNIFGFTENATIKNLTVSNSTVDITNPADYLVSAATAYYDFGMLAVKMTGGSVSGIKFTDSVKINYTFDKKSYAGGMIGRATGGFSVSNCINYADITTNNAQITLFGGIVAMSEGADTSLDATTSTITSCFNYGKIHDANTQSSDSKVSGILGAGYGVTVSGCGNYGEIKSDEPIGAVSGIFAFPSGAFYHITACVNAANISGGNNTGGIMGFSSRANGVIDNCVNIGTITGATNVGAILGKANSSETIKDSFYLTGTAEQGVKTTSGTVTNVVSCEKLANIIEECNKISTLKNIFKVSGNSIVFASNEAPVTTASKNTTSAATSDNAAIIVLVAVAAVSFAAFSTKRRISVK